MKKWEKFKKKMNDYMYDHLFLRKSLSNAWTFILSVVAAFLFAFAFTCFVTPLEGSGDMTLVTGGVSGLSQNIIQIVRLCGGNVDTYNLQSILYFAFNVPILIFGFICVGKKFTVYTIINVVLTSIFISLFPEIGFSEPIQEATVISSSMLTRTLFAGICIGTSAAIAFKGNFSCGGMDVISYYFSMRRSTSVGQYMILFNGIIITLYAIVLFAGNPSEYPVALLSILFSITEIIVSSMIIDAINTRNKKVQIQLISSSDYLSDVLLAYFPHGATVMEGKGAYSGSTYKVIYMIVSSNEIKQVADVARKVDPNVFVSATPLQQVYGNFFIKPVE